MTAVVPTRGELEASRPYPLRTGPKGNLIYKLLTTTDHKLIGIMYVVACFVFFAVAGLMALFIRAELTVPGLQFLSNEQYNQLFTMHGTAMLLFYATPIVFGFANLVLPLQIGAPDVAFPRLNALSYWLFTFGALIALGGFITPGGAADFGVTVYVPLSDSVHDPSGWSVTSMWSQYPASASSTELSMISQRQCMRPRPSVDPMYMPGRLRTASRPSST